MFEYSSYEKLVYNISKYVQHYRVDTRLDPFEKGREFENEFYIILKDLEKIRTLSESGHFDLGMGASPLSGLNHEIDCVATDGESIYLFELKHYFSGEVTKDMVLIFNQKVLDFAFNYLQRISSVDFHPIFLTQSQSIRDDIRIFCQIWGMSFIDRHMLHPVVMQKIVTQLESEFGNLFSAEFREKFDYLLDREKRRLSDMLEVWSPGAVTIKIGGDAFEKAKEAVNFHKETLATLKRIINEVKNASTYYHS